VRTRSRPLPPRGRRCVPLLALLPVLLATPGCGGDGDRGTTGPGTDAAAPASADPGIAPAARSPRGAATGERELVVFLGDSLTAGYGLAEDEAYPAILGRLLREEGHPIEVLNAGWSGDTTAGGLRRLDWVLSQEPSILVAELGANDGLRGLPLEHTEENLRQILRRAREAGAAPLLVGMQVPPNYGPDYAPAFTEIYPRLADELDVPLVELLLDGVGGRPELNLADGIHPTAEGHRILAHNVLPRLRAMLASPPAQDEGVR
jgi:acyl-CoA thioesterase-1